MQIRSFQKCFALFLFLAFTVSARGQSQTGAQTGTVPEGQAGAPTAPANTKTDAPSGTKTKTNALTISVNWRVRVEGWDWFEDPSGGNNNYGFGHSLLRVAIRQELDRFDWEVEAAQDAILGLPNDAVVAAPQGQLGLGGTYYAANGNNANNANAYIKQAFVRFKKAGPASVKVGRFEFFDGLEIKPQDPSLATIVQTRLAHRLISNFGFSAVQRSFDGVQASANLGANNLTFFAARPTRGVFQVDGNGELDVDAYYGAFSRPINWSHNAAELRVFGLGYIDHRTTVLKTDNRAAPARAADLDKIEIATFGADYAQVLDAQSAGKFDFAGWGAFQTGSWGTQTQRAGALVGEVGWQPAVDVLHPWLSAGYSYGSGDGNPNDSHHGTFFQVLTTPRLYARFPFYNMMNNEDAYATLDLHPTSRLSLRSEGHALRLASAADLWYLGGGAFQRKTFGYTGRPSNGERSLANVWDVSADYKFSRFFAATLYYGHAWGKSVIASIYPGNPNAQFVYLETNVHF